MSSENAQEIHVDTLDATEVAARLEEGLHALEDQVSGSKEQIERLNSAAMNLIREQPLIAVAGAFGVGYLLGSLASRRWIV
jgi:ElaB/YqjD/DUF883 family membrane-anchored ribosome-binding protein